MVKLSSKRLKEDAVYFCETILGVTLHEGQKKILNSKSRFQAIAAPRRWGKSQVEACFATWMAATNENCRIICVSKSKRQADEIFQKIYQLVTGSVLVNSLTRNTLSRIEFDNGSVIESLPSRSPENLRGMTIGLCIADEAAFIPDSVFEALFPVILNTRGKINGKLVLVSTPGIKSGEFYRAFQPDSIYTTFNFTHEDAVFSNGERLLPQAELDREGQRMGFDSAFFKREYLCQWGNSEDSFFDIEGIEKSLIPDLPQLKYGLPDHKYVMSVDIGLSQDYTIIIHLDKTDKECLKIVRTVRFTGKTTDQIMDILYKEALAFEPSNILIDDGKVGIALISHLRVAYPRFKWSGFNFNTSSKTPLMYDLNLAMAKGIIQIPEDNQIREELISFCYAENPNTKHIKTGGKGAHDDLVIAIALALRCANIFTKKGDYIIGSNKGILTLPKNAKHPPRHSKVIHY